MIVRQKNSSVLIHYTQLAYISVPQHPMPLFGQAEGQRWASIELEGSRALTWMWYFPLHFL